MIEICQDQGLLSPKFEEIDNFFRVTLYNSTIKPQKMENWEKLIIERVEEHGKISAKQAKEIWKVTPKTAGARLKKVCDKGLLVEISTEPYDPYKTFVKPSNQIGNALKFEITKLIFGVKSKKEIRAI